MPTSKCIGILKNGSTCLIYTKGESSYCGRHQSQDSNRTISVGNPGSKYSTASSFSGSDYGGVLQSLSVMSIGRDTPISSVEENEISIDEDLDYTSEGSSDCDDGGYGAQYSPTQAKLNRITAVRSARRSTLSPATLLHVSETSTASPINRRAKSQEPVKLTRRNDRRSQNSFQKDQPSGMGLQDFLSTLLSSQETAIASSLPKLFPDALRGRLWAQVCKGPTKSDGVGTIYVYKTTSPSKGLHASPRADVGNVVIKIGKTTNINQRRRQHAGNTSCNLEFELLKLWPEVTYHGRVEKMIMTTLGRRKYGGDCGAGCTTDHKEMFEVCESELPYVYEIIEEWVAWGKKLDMETEIY